ncbi:uncharacterized protein OCT59_027903 [Rhizophagus irregularis]|uniref:uncharacterized protein n=1 Tax=Rhizophagus irregularis TaxID=588596 RepID=UPI00333242CB|nr:hypothetical protein OCT59_027903 [Rhizophagus irregularis]
MQDSQLNNEDSTEKCDEKYKSNNLLDDDGNVLSDDGDNVSSDDNGNILSDDGDNVLSDNDNDILPSISSDTSDNKKKPKNQVHAKQKRITKLDQIKNKNLQRHPIVNKIITRNKVQRKCGKIIKLHQAYNSQNLEIYSKTGSCLLIKGTHPLTDYFTTITTKSGNSYVRLREKKHVKLTSKETAQLENELAARAKWYNDFSAGCIRSMECEILTVNKENICNKCMELNSDKNLKNVIIRPIPQIENRKFIPKYLVKKNPIVKYLKDSSLN